MIEVRNWRREGFDRLGLSGIFLAADYQSPLRLSLSKVARQGCR
jgi:hypothetical protein